MSSPSSAIEGMDSISITSSSISNTRTLNVLFFNAGIPVATDRITIASDTRNSSQAESIRICLQSIITSTWEQQKMFHHI
eukprot:15103700-Ditylum_brightwellii.AAC.1